MTTGCYKEQINYGEEKYRNRNDSMTNVLDPDDFQDAVNKAADFILSGRLVAFPTESFYGLGVDATNEDAIKRLFLIKQRELNRPILILISSEAVLSRFVERIPPVAYQLMEEFWPGGLTLVFEAGQKLSPLLTGGTGKIGIRVSSHPVVMSLTRAVGRPISGTSANISGKSACIDASEVLKVFGDRVDFTLDGGRLEGKTGSTVLDVTVCPPKILRRGIITKDQLDEFI